MLAPALIVLSVLYFLYHEFVGKRKNYPPGPVPFPLIGNIHQLGTVDPQKKTVEWSKEFGPIFTLWIGSYPNIVITDYQIMKDTLIKQGEAFAGRPNNFVFTNFRKGKHFGLVINDGQVWKEQRRFALHVLRDLGLGKPLMEEKVMTEVHKLIAKIKHTTDWPDYHVDIMDHMELRVANIISTFLVGHTLDTESKFRTLTKRLGELIKLTVKPEVLLLGQHPWLRHLPLFGHFGYSELCKARDEFYGLSGEDVKVHRAGFNPDVAPSDYTGAFMKEMHRRKEAGEPAESFTDWQLNTALLDMWGAGMETTMTTLKWGLLFMTRRPDVQERCFQEIQEVLSDRESNTLNGRSPSHPVPCGSNFRNPTLCKHRSHKLAAPNNKASAHRWLYGEVKVGTSILPQISAVLMDEKYFGDAEIFDPDRFMDQNGKTSTTEMVIPFSMGKRVCLGESLARMELFLIFGTLIQNFRFSVPKGEAVPPAEATASFIRSPKPYAISVLVR